MSNGPIKITQLPVATSTNPTQDLMVIVQNTAGTNTTYSIAPSVLLAQTAYYSSNNASYLGGVAANSYQLNSTLGANVASYLPTYSNVINASSYTIGTFLVHHPHLLVLVVLIVLLISSSPMLTMVSMHHPTLLLMTITVCSETTSLI